MARLSGQVRYFINKKISEDSNWRDIEVVFSGHIHENGLERLFDVYKTVLPSLG